MTNSVADATEIARCAEITCHLAHTPAEAHRELVARFGLTWSHWEAIAAHWAGAREAELAAGGAQLCSLFVRSFTATAERLNAPTTSVELPVAAGQSPWPTVEVGRTPPGAEDIGAPRLGAVDALAGTSDVDLRAIIATVTGGSVPFRGNRSTLESAERRPAPAAVATGTIGTDYRAIVAAIDKPSSLPFGDAEAARIAKPANAAVAETTQLTLDTYAAISGALARGEPRDPVLARHGMTAMHFDQQARAWGARFQAEPELLVRFRELVRRTM